MGFSLCCCQAQILEFGLAVHEKFVPQDMRPLHKKLVDQFFVMKSSFGIQVCAEGPWWGHLNTAAASCEVMDEKSNSDIFWFFYHIAAFSIGAFNITITFLMFAMFSLYENKTKKVNVSNTGIYNWSLFKDAEDVY